MSYGAKATNTSGKILISSDIYGMHYQGKATYIDTPYGGINDFPNYSADDGQYTLSGVWLHRYQVIASSLPLFFIRASNTSAFHAVLRQYSPSGNLWMVEILQSGATSSPPQIYVFTKAADAPVRGGSYGMVVPHINGGTAFDSRKMPLSIVYAGGVQPPTLPCDGGQPTQQSGFAWNDETLDFDFHCNTTYNSTSISGIDPQNYMFSAPSPAQAVYTREKDGFKRSYGTYSSQDHWSSAIWWVMYHQAYRISTNALHAGWCTYAAGYYFTSTWEGTGFFEFSGGGGAVTAGDRPFNDKTINLSTNTAIVANATVYD